VPLGRKLFFDGRLPVDGTVSCATCPEVTRGFADQRPAPKGARIFHSAKELGSTIAVSCDMCHPDAANTQPETYPKYKSRWARRCSCAT